MPETEPSISSEPAVSETRNLPAVIPQPIESARTLNDGWVSRMLRTLFNWKAGSIRADLEVVLEAGAPGETGFSPEESTMLKNILGLRERRVEDVMLPRADIVAVQRDISLGELVRVFEGAGHSRLVVYNDTLDDPIGMVHIRDLIGFMTARAAIDPETAVTKRKKSLPAGLDLKAIDLSMSLADTNIMRELLFVPPSMPAIDLLAKMQATRIHLALVIDEYGGSDGLISMEDIVELIVGDIADEHDQEEAPYIVHQPDGSYIADARADLEEVTATVGEFDVGEAADDVDTLGGYLVMKAGRVPVRGELVPGPGTFEIEILDADPRRVKRVRIYRRKDRKSARPRDARRRPTDADTAAPAVETTPPKADSQS